MIDKYFEFECGCKVKQYSDLTKDYDGLPKLKIDYYSLSLNCPQTYELLSLGRTRGLFQLESSFAKQYTKKLQPECIEHISALAALLRPGCIQAYSEGKSMTDHFIDRRHGKDEVKYIDDRLKEYLSDTYGILVYQEQMIAIAGGLAGFDGKQRNKLRKSVGKKDVESLFSLRELFINGCIKNNVSNENSNLIFDNIESAGRYSLNLSHAYAYGVISYWSAWVKSHFPLHFFCAFFKHVKDNDQLKDLMSELSVFNIDVKNPSISNLSERFTIKDGYIQYGYGEIKDVGKDAVNLINKIVNIEKKLDKQAKDFTWYEFLVNVSQLVSKTTINNLIMCGFLDNTGISRTQQLHEYNTFSQLTETKLNWINENWRNYNNLTDLLSGLLSIIPEFMKKKKNEIEDKPNKDYGKIESLVNSLKNPGKSLVDTPKNLYKIEKELMGVAVSADPISSKERLANIKCASFNSGKGAKGLRLVTIVKSVKEKIVKDGINKSKKYANVIVSDKTGEIEFTIFTKYWMDFKSLFVEGNILLINGRRNNDKSFCVENAEIL